MPLLPHPFDYANAAIYGLSLFSSQIRAGTSSLQGARAHTHTSRLNILLFQTRLHSDTGNSNSKRIEVIVRNVYILYQTRGNSVHSRGGNGKECTWTHSLRYASPHITDQRTGGWRGLTGGGSNGTRGQTETPTWRQIPKDHSLERPMSEQSAWQKLHNR